MRPRAALQPVDDLRRRQRRVHAEHQTDHAGDHRRGKAGAGLAHVDGIAHAAQPVVAQGQQAVVAQFEAPVADHARVAAHGGDGHLRAEVRVAGLEAVAIQRRHAEHAAAVGWPRHRAVLVAGRRDDDHADPAQLVDRLLVGRVAGRAAAEADVQHARRIRVQRHRPAGIVEHLQAGRPAHAYDDVGHFGAALAGHAHRQHASAPVDAGDTARIAGLGGEHAGDGGAVPGAVVDLAIAEQRRVGIALGLADPVVRDLLHRRPSRRRRWRIRRSRRSRGRPARRSRGRHAA